MRDSLGRSRSADYWDGPDGETYLARFIILTERKKMGRVGFITDFDAIRGAIKFEPKTAPKPVKKPAKRGIKRK